MKRGYVAGGIVIALCLLTAGFSLRGAATPHVTFRQAMARGEAAQVYGKLLKDSVKMDRGMTRVEFQVEEERTGERMSILWDKPDEAVSANFASASHVRAVGLYDPQRAVFVTTQLYTKCPSKYQSEGYKAEKQADYPGR